MHRRTFLSALAALPAVACIPPAGDPLVELQSLTWLPAGDRIQAVTGCCLNADSDEWVITLSTERGLVREFTLNRPTLSEMRLFLHLTGATGRC